MLGTSFFPSALGIANAFWFSGSVLLFLKIFLFIGAMIVLAVALLGFLARLVLDLFGVVDQPARESDDRYA